MEDKSGGNRSDNDETTGRTEPTINKNNKRIAVLANQFVSRHQVFHWIRYIMLYTKD